MNDANVSVVSTPADFAQMLPEMKELADRVSALPITLRPEWWSIAIRLHNLDDLFVIAVRTCDGRLVGVAPFYRTKARLFGIYTVRVLRPIGDRSNSFEYSGWIIDDEFIIAYRLVVELLRREKKSYDLIWLPKSTDKYLQPISQEIRRALLPFRRRERVFSAVPLPDSLEDFERRFSPKSRNRLRRNTKQVLQATNAKLVRCNNEADLNEFLEALFHLHQRRWESVGRSGAFERNPVEREFYKEFSKVALHEGWLDIYALKMSSTFVAVQFGYTVNGVFYQFQEGYEPSLGQGTGNALRHLVFKDLIRRGIDCYDFMEGWSEHKRMWRAKKEIGRDVIVGSPRIQSRLLIYIPIWPSGRFFTWLA